MKKLIIFSLLAVFMASTVDLTAQRIKDWENYSFDVGTMLSDTSSSNTLLFEYPKNIIGLYTANWHCKVTNLTGTSAGTVTLQVSNCPTCSDWSTIATFALSTTLDSLITVTQVPGMRLRARYASSGTGSGSVSNHVTLGKLY